MHELSLCQTIAETVVEHADARPVEVVRLRIGHLRQVVPETLEYCWTLVIADTPLHGARLEIDHVAAVIACRECGESTTLEVPIRRCGACGSASTEVITGDEFLIDSIDVAAGDASTAKG